MSWAGFICSSSYKRVSGSSVCSCLSLSLLLSLSKVVFSSWSMSCSVDFPVFAAAWMRYDGSWPEDMTFRLCSGLGDDGDDEDNGDDGVSKSFRFGEDDIPPRD